MNLVRLPDVLRLEHQLGDSFGGAHHADGVDRLVARDQDEPFDAALFRKLGGRLRAEHVVLHRLTDVELHQRNVLVSRGVKDDIRPMLLEHRPEPGPIGDISDDRVGIGGGAAASIEIVEHAVKTVLVALVQNQGGGAESGDLTAQLGTDGSSCAGDENRLSFDQSQKGLAAQADRRAPQQILQRKVANLTGRYVSVQDLAQVRQAS